MRGKKKRRKLTKAQNKAMDKLVYDDMVKQVVDYAFELNQLLNQPIAWAKDAKYQSDPVEVYYEAMKPLCQTK